MGKNLRFYNDEQSFELIEAKNFDINYHQLSIIVHPQSYIHAILEFKMG